MNSKRQKLMLVSAFAGMSLIALSQITHAESEASPAADSPSTTVAKPMAPEPVVAADVPGTPTQPTPAVVPTPAAEPTRPVVAPTPPAPATPSSPARPVKPEPEVLPDGETESVPGVAAVLPEPFSRLMAHDSNVNRQARSLVVEEQRRQRRELQAMREQVQTLRQKQRHTQNRKLSESQAKIRDHQRSLATVQQRALIRQHEAKQSIAAVREEQRQRVNDLRQTAQQATQKARLVREQARAEIQQRQRNQ